jgi:hypothetical protein
MKKIVLTMVAIAVSALSSASMATMSYECWTYVGGHPDKMTHISANSSGEAESLVAAKFKDLGAKWDYIKCH